MTGMPRRCKRRVAAPAIKTECATRFAPPSMNGTCCATTRTIALKLKATSFAIHMKRMSTWNGNPRTMPNSGRLFLLV